MGGADRRQALQKLGIQVTQPGSRVSLARATVPPKFWSLILASNLEFSLYMCAKHLTYKGLLFVITAYEGYAAITPFFR